MIGLEPSHLPDRVANALMLACPGLAPLEWHIRPSRAARDLLDEASDEASLLGRSNLADDSMACAVRGLLLLWAGHAADALMYSQIAPEPERMFIKGIVHRQAGEGNEAKQAFHLTTKHPIYVPLMEYAMEAVGLGVDSSLRRFAAQLKMTGEWEPYAFIDLFEQARAGTLCEAANMVVRQIQAREFELLFVHCYEKATGRPFPKPDKAADERPVRKRRPPSTRPKRPTPVRPEKKAEAPAPAKPKPKPKPDGKLRIACPKCNQVVEASVSSRGQMVQCGKCKTKFVVPGGSSPSNPSRAAVSSTVGVGCPRCGTVLRFPLAARGTTQKCTKCNAAFKVPAGKSAKPAARS